MTWELVPEKVVYLHETIASGTFGNVPYEIDRLLPSNSIVIRYQGKRAIIHLKDIVKEGLDFIEKELK